MYKILSPLIILLLLLTPFIKITATEFSENKVSSEYEVILTGEVKAGDIQNFTVPWSENWRQQIKWMKPEGEIVEEGDLVVSFDTANLDAKVEQEKVNLRQSKDEAKNNQLDLEQKLINAEHDVIKAELEFKLAQLLADVPTKFRSKLEDDNTKFDLKKSEKNLALSKIKLETAKYSLKAEEEKQTIETQKITAVLNKIENELDQMQLKSQRKGAVLHATHPWDGSKITEGQSVQTSWDVASIPGLGNESVQAWVNEVDWPRINIGQAVKLTLDAYPNKHFSGEIKRIGLQAESKKAWGKATYYDVEITLNDKSNSLLVPGMSVRIEVLTNQILSERTLTPVSSSSSPLLIARMTNKENN